MDKKNIIYITKKHLINLPDDTPIYVLLDPESPDDEPESVENYVHDKVNDESADNENFVVDNEGLQKETVPLITEKIYNDHCESDNHMLPNIESENKDISNSMIKTICDDNETNIHNGSIDNFSKTNLPNTGFNSIENICLESVLSQQIDMESNLNAFVNTIPVFEETIYEDVDDEFVLSIDIETSNVKCTETPDHLTQFYDSLYNDEDESYPKFDPELMNKCENLEEIVKINLEGMLGDNNAESMDVESEDQQNYDDKKEADEDLVKDSVIQKQFDDKAVIVKIDMDVESEDQQNYDDKKEADEDLVKDSVIQKQFDNKAEIVNIDIGVEKTPDNVTKLEIDTVKPIPDSCYNSAEISSISDQFSFPVPVPIKLENRFMPPLPLNFSFTSVPPPGYPESLMLPKTKEPSQQEINSTKKEKFEEVRKIKQRRRKDALHEPRRSVEFKVISHLEMDLNDKYLVYSKKGRKEVVGTKAMKTLEDEFEKQILNRSKEVIENTTDQWEPLNRNQNTSYKDKSDETLEISFSDSEDDDEDHQENSETETMSQRDNNAAIGNNSDDDSVYLSSTDEEIEEEGCDESSSTAQNKKQKGPADSVDVNPVAVASSSITGGAGGVFTEFQLKQLARIEKKVAATRKKLNLQYSSNKHDDNQASSTKSKQSSGRCNYACRKRCRHGNSNKSGGGGLNPPCAKKPKQSIDYRTIQENKLANNAPVISAGRSRQQQLEINHKLSHPRKLHPDIWYNERNELNDGPSCCCHPKSQIGPLHNDFPGETDNAIPVCHPISNNYKHLYHYRLIISPAMNFLSSQPTIIRHKGKSFCFSGFSLFTHQPLVDLPVCQVVRYNIIYQLTLISDHFPVGFTVRSLDLITEYLFTDLLELLDVDWFPKSTNQNESCRCVHLMPRFEWTQNNHAEAMQNNKNESTSGVPVKMLSTDVILQWLLDNGTQPLFDIIDLPRLQSMSLSEWSEFVDPLRGTLACYPGKKPSALRIDQLDRESLDLPRQENVITFPVLVHMNMVPLKLGLTREPAYKRLLKNFLKLQYLILNRPEFTKDDRIELNNLARLLENFEMNGIQRREFTVEICSDGFYRTGIKTDIVQCALCVPSIMSHIRFHFSLSQLEDRIKYQFKDKSLLHQALTHPSYLNTNYGTNPDHYQNTNVSCGLRHIQYGDKISLYRSFRKKGLSKMVQVMSYMPFKHETRSTIFGNERLECLGDAVIELITSVHLFYMFPELSEGHLDSFRQALVQNHYLADLAVRLGLHQYLLYTHNTDFSFDSTITHARSDAFEAIMAAITLDGGLNEADRIFGSVVFGDDSRINRVWCELPEHQLQQQFPNGDRHVIHNSPIFMNLTNLEDRLGITFKHIRLLAKAMTIRKTGYNIFTLGDNQRLEFLGDSLLKYVSTDYLFKHFPRHHEGHLSLLRNTLVNRYTQARVCRELGLDEFIIRKDGQSNSVGVVGNSINGIKNMTPQQQKCTQKPHADLLEAFLGALFVDKDLTWVERFCQVCFWPRLVHFILNQKWNDPKSRLQQCCLTYRSINEDPEIAHYKLISTYGSTDNREFKVAVYFRGIRMATGYGSSIQIAEMNAATQALDNYKDNFKQLNYQEKVIEQKYDTGVRKKMLEQFETWDKELVDRFMGEEPSGSCTTGHDKRPQSGSYKSKYEGGRDCQRTGRFESTRSIESKEERVRNLKLSSTLGGLIKNNAHHH